MKLIWRRRWALTCLPQKSRQVKMVETKGSKTMPPGMRHFCEASSGKPHSPHVENQGRMDQLLEHLREEVWNLWPGHLMRFSTGVLCRGQRVGVVMKIL